MNIQNIIRPLIFIILILLLKNLKHLQDKRSKKIKAIVLLCLFSIITVFTMIYTIVSTIEGGKYVILFNISLLSFTLLFLLFLFSKKKFIKKEEFFREFPEELSVPMAIYLMKRKIETKKALLGTTLLLYAKEAINIDFENTPWEYSEKKQISKREDETYIYDFLLGRKPQKNFSGKELTNIVIKNLENKNLIKKTKTNPFQIVTLVLLIVTIIYAISFTYVPFEFAEKTYDFVLILLFTFGFITIKITKKERYIPTKEGKVLLKKLQAFQNYIVNFSHLKNRKLEEVVLWKEYLAYAIALGINANYDSFKEEMPFLTQIVINDYIENKIDYLANLYDRILDEMEEKETALK